MKNIIKSLIVYLLNMYYKKNGFVIFLIKSPIENNWHHWIDEFECNPRPIRSHYSRVSAYKTYVKRKINNKDVWVSGYVSTSLKFAIRETKVFIRNIKIDNKYGLRFDDVNVKTSDFHNFLIREAEKNAK